MKKLILAALLSTPALGNVTVCEGCHGKSGASVMPKTPNLQGQKWQYTYKQLKDFKSGVRKDPAMEMITKALTDEDMVKLSKYFEGK